MMTNWRVFWHLGAPHGEALGRSLIALDFRILRSEGEARRLVTELLNSETVGVSMRRPDSARIVKGEELRRWLRPTG